MKWIFMAAIVMVSPWASAAGAPCEVSIEQLHLSRAWVRSLHDGVVSWRNASTREAITTASYAIVPSLSSLQRAALALKSVEEERAGERRWGSAQLSLSTIERRQAGAALQLCHTGFDPGQNRGFVSVTRLSGTLLTHIYYEAAGVSPREFARSAAGTLGLRAATSAAPDALRSGLHEGRRELPVPLGGLGVK